MIEKYINIAKGFYEKNDCVKAVVWYTQALRINPKDDNLYLLRASCKSRLRDYIGELEDCSMAIKLNPDNINAYVARICIKKYIFVDITGALLDAQKIIEINPNSILGYSLLCDLFSELNDEHKSRQMYLKAKSITPISPLDFHERGDFHKEDLEYEEAIIDYTSAIEMELCAVVFALIQRAFCKEKLGEYDKAINDYLRAIELDTRPHNMLYIKIANCNEILKDYDKAIEYYSKAIEEDASSCLSYQKRGELKIKLGKIEEGNADIQKSILLKRKSYNRLRNTDYLSRFEKIKII